jgi:signal transduction histidine kinase
MRSATCQAQRGSFRLGFPPLRGKADDAAMPRLLAAHIEALLPPGHGPVPQAWCASILRREGAHRRCLAPQDGLFCAVEAIHFSSSSLGHLVLVTVRDAAEALLDQQWRDAERMEVMIATAGVLAHKTNNTLTGLLGGAEHLTDMPDLSGEAMQSAQMIVTAVDKLEHMTRRIGRLSAAARPQAGQCDPARQLTELADMSRPGLPEGVSMSVEAREGQGQLLVDGRGLRMACQELISNALNALDGRGHIRLAVTPGAEPAWPGFGWLALSVADDGPGIDDATIEVLGDGLAARVGRGNMLPLGLHIARAFSMALGGSLTIERPPAGGTHVSMGLPVLLDAGCIPPPMASNIVHDA